MAKRVQHEFNDEIFERTFLGLISGREEVAKILKESAVFELEEGEAIVREGRAAGELAIILSGSGGGLPAWSAIDLPVVLSSGTHPSTIAAGEKSEVLLIPWRKLKGLLAKTPGLETYLSRTAAEGPLKNLDLQMSDMDCTAPFRVALIGAMAPANLKPGEWLVKEGDTPDFAFYMGDGALQALRKLSNVALKPLWKVPGGTWQLWDECRAQRPLGHSLKAESALELHKLPTSTISEFEKKFTEDFPKFESLAQAPGEAVEKEDEEDQDVEKLSDLFPPFPRKVSSFRWRYPHVQQNDEMDCAPACLAMISRFYGNDIPIQYWRERMGTDRQGTSLFDIATASEKAGFVAHGLEVTDFDEIDESLFPFIALRRYHYLVIYKRKGESLIVGDPGVGIRKMKIADFMKGYEGYCVLLRPTEQFYQETAAERGAINYAEMLRGHEQELAVVSACSLLLVAFNMAPAFLSQFILDEVLAKKDPRLLFIVLGGAVLITTMISLTTWLRSYFMAYITSKFDFASSSAFMRKLFSLPYDFFATRHVGDFTRRLAELERVRGFFTGEIISVLLDFLNLGLYGVVIFLYSPKIALATFILAPTLVLVSILFSKKLQLNFSESFSARSDQEALVADLIKGVATVKTTGSELAVRWRFEEALVKTLRARYNFAMTGAALGGLSGFLNQMVHFAIVGLAAYLAINGGLTPGQVISSSMLVHQVLAPFHGLAGCWSEFQEIRIVMNRLNDVFLAQSERSPSARALVKKRIRGEIEFKDVWFRYGGESSEWILKGMSFHIQPGQSVAIVGPSGAGKSTLALLTARLYEPNKGVILIDGRDYRDYDRQWLRTQVGLLLQENNLFYGSVAENIAYGDARPEFAKVQKASEMAFAHNFIAEKPAGYDYMITHGGLGLSGGEKQKVAIARTLYTNPAILFLDEATAALDANSERAVTRNLKGESGRRTIVSIAHRYSTVRASDYAMVVYGGRVEEFGTHEELLAKGGHYTNLFGDQIDA